MGIEKAAAKLATLNDVGNELDDALEGAMKELATVEGGILSAKTIGDLIAGLYKAVDRDIEGGKIPTNEPLLIAKYVKGYIEQAKKLAEDEGIRCVHSRFEHQGRITAWEDAVKRVKKLHDVQRGKLEKYDQELAAQQRGDVGGNANGDVNPRPSFKEMQARRAREFENKEIAKKPEDKSSGGELVPLKLKPRGKTRKRRKPQ